MKELRMPDVNNVLIAGNLTRDPSFRKTTNGTPVTNFWIASNRKFKDNTGQWRENVCYVGVVAWYKLAESCAENLHKGGAVLVEGELQSRSLRTEDGRNRNIVEIKARRVQFLNRKDEAFENDHEDGYSEENTLDDYSMDSEDTKDSSDTSEVSDSEKAAGSQSNYEPEEDDHNNPLKGKFNFGFEDLEL